MKNQVSNTDINLVRDTFKNFEPKDLGIISNDEMKMLDIMLELDGRDVLSLRNLRNCIVMYHMIHTDPKESLSPKEQIRANDTLSAVVAAVDAKIIRLGGEV